MKHFKAQAHTNTIPPSSLLLNTKLCCNKPLNLHKGDAQTQVEVHLWDTYNVTLQIYTCHSTLLLVCYLW